MTLDDQGEETDSGTPLDQPTPDAPDIVDAMAQLRSLFDTLVPLDKLDLGDAFGNTYTVRAVLPARSQILVMQHLHRLWESDIPGLTAVQAGGASSIAGSIVALATDERILDGISEAFAIAHPRAVASACIAAKEEGITSTHPADLFPVEDMVAGLVPFFIRFAARAADLMSAVTTQDAPSA